MYNRILPIFLGTFLAIGAHGIAQAEPPTQSSTAQPSTVRSSKNANAPAIRMVSQKQAAPTSNPQIGKASWYGKHWRGRPTASGEPMNPDKLTAASKTLPIGSTVEVTNMNNGKTVRVRINDRGPYVKGRVIDLAEKAADQIGMKQTGVTPVTIRPIEEAARDVPVVDLN